MSNKLDWKLCGASSPISTWTSPINSWHNQPAWMHFSSKSSSPCPSSIHQHHQSLPHQRREVTFWPAASQAYRKEVTYWPAPVEPARLRNYHHQQASCGQNHRPLWGSPAAIFQAGRSLSHKRQFPELKTKSEWMTIQPSAHYRPPSSSSRLSSPSISSSFGSHQSTASSGLMSNNNRPYRNNSSAVAACLYQQDHHSAGRW